MVLTLPVNGSAIDSGKVTVCPSRQPSQAVSALYITSRYDSIGTKPSVMDVLFAMLLSSCVILNWRVAASCG